MLIRKQKKLNLRLFFISLLFVSSIFAQDLFFKRAYAQAYGNIGQISIGLGDNWTENLRWSIFYGYVSRSYGGDVSINSLAFKMDYELFTKIGFYAGIGVLYVLNQHYRSQFRDKYPDNTYYHMTSIHLFPFIGLRQEIEVLENKVSPYIEIGSLDVYLVSYHSNPNSLDLTDLINIAFGVSYDF